MTHMVLLQDMSTEELDEFTFDTEDFLQSSEEWEDFYEHYDIDQVAIACEELRSARTELTGREE
jgi:hypothetical protein